MPDFIYSVFTAVVVDFAKITSKISRFSLVNFPFMDRNRIFRIDFLS